MAKLVVLCGASAVDMLHGVSGLGQLLRHDLAMVLPPILVEAQKCCSATLCVPNELDECMAGFVAPDVWQNAIG